MMEALNINEAKALQKAYDELSKKPLEEWDAATRGLIYKSLKGSVEECLKEMRVLSEYLKEQHGTRLYLMRCLTSKGDWEIERVSKFLNRGAKFIPLNRFDDPAFEKLSHLVAFTPFPGSEKPKISPTVLVTPKATPDVCFVEMPLSAYEETK